MDNEIVPAVPPVPAPDAAVRHHYPLAIRQASFGTALGLFLKTMPYALARFGVLVVVSLVTIVWALLTFGGRPGRATRSIRSSAGAGSPSAPASTAGPGISSSATPST